MEDKVLIENVENLRTSTGVKVDENGHRRLVTKIQFEAEVDSAALANVHQLLASKAKVHVVIG